MCFGAILIENRSVFMFKSKIISPDNWYLPPHSSVQIKTAKTQKHLYCPVFTSLVVDFTVGHFFLRFYGGLRAFSGRKTVSMFHYCHSPVQPKRTQKPVSVADIFRSWHRFLRFPPQILRKNPRRGCRSFRPEYRWSAQMKRAYFKGAKFQGEVRPF